MVIKICGISVEQIAFQFAHWRIQGLFRTGGVVFVVALLNLLTQLDQGPDLNSFHEPAPTNFAIEGRLLCLDTSERQLITYFFGTEWL